jgi:ABC-type dipeptide/oligopeptide/nickel transport system permease component
VVQTIVLLSALSYMVTTLLVDVLYAWLDPRISYGGSRS